MNRFEPLSPTDTRRILIARIGALGDTLMATPVARALKKQFSSASIDFLSSGPAGPLLRNNPYIDRVLTLQHRNVPYFASPEKRALSRKISKSAYDVAILLESAPRYAYLLQRAGLKRILSFETSPFDPSDHSIVNNLRVAGICEPPPEDLDMDLLPGREDRTVARELLSGLPSPILGLHVGYGPAAGKRVQMERLKGWTSRHFQIVIERLQERGVGIVLTGSGQDRAETERIASRLPSQNVRVLAGRTSVSELAAVIEKLDLYISVDSGPAHMAAALGTPLIVLWGPAKLHQVRPLSTRSTIEILQHGVPCAPCYDTPSMKSCLKNICMQGITPAQVCLRTEEVLQAGMLLRNSGKNTTISRTGWTPA